MIESAMYFCIGFFLACLGAFAVVPLIQGRAVRLTRRRLEATIPSSMAEILADKDLLRAEFAVSTRRLETSLEQLKVRSASQLAELGRKSDAVNRLKIELSALRDKVGPTEQEFAVKAGAVRAAERALSDKELQLANLMEKLTERSTHAATQEIEIDALKTQLEELKTQLDSELKAAERRADAERTLFEKESELAKVISESDERSTLADHQKIEIIALKTEIDALKKRLDEANNELKAVEEYRNTERLKLKATSDRLMDELEKFEDFRRCVTKHVQQLMAQSTEDDLRAEELEERLLKQSRLVNELEIELTHLRGEFEIARKAEADLRVALIEIDSRENIAMQKLETENAKLKAALDRASGERVRLTHELANKNRYNIGTDGTQRVEYGRLPRRTNLGPGRLVKAHEDRGAH